MSRSIYETDTPENKLDMLPKQRDGLVCSNCGMVMDRTYVNPDFQVRKYSVDISHTYDGFTIGSEKFKLFIESEGYSGIHFKLLPSALGFYSILFENIVRVGFPHLKADEYCYVCERFNSVWDATGMVIKLIKGNDLAEGFYASDLKMGYKLMMFPVLFATAGVKKAAEKAKLRGLTFLEKVNIDIVVS